MSMWLRNIVLGGLSVAICLSADVSLAHAAPPGSPQGLKGSKVVSTEAHKLRQARELAGFAPLAARGGKTLKVRVQKQSTDYYCAPASGRVALSALRSKLPRQSTIARKMGTTPNGTSINRIAPGLNAFQSKNPYVTARGLSLEQFRKRIVWGIGTYKAPSINVVQMGQLPWYLNQGISGRHALATYGYYRAVKRWQMKMYDPWDGKRHENADSGRIYDASLDHAIIW